MIDRAMQTRERLLEQFPEYPLMQIEEKLQKGRVILAIEGPCASGKSTLAGLLKQIYGCSVFHMDDFFLRPEQRTTERLAKPGENVDWERFLEEVLLPISQDKSVTYRPFDCSVMALKDGIVIEPGRFVVIEGAYCMHPQLREYYDFSLFLNIDSDLQKKRIQKRNTPEKAERFFSTWIPMEQKYFKELAIKEYCDLVIEVK